MKQEENNEKRLIASEIITELYEAKELGQIQLLFMQCMLSFKSLDPQGWRTFMKDNAIK